MNTLFYLMFIGLILLAFIFLVLGLIRRNKSLIWISAGIFIVWFVYWKITDDWLLLFYGPFILAIVLMIVGVVNKSITLKLISIGLFIVWIIYLFFSGAMFFN